MQTKISILVPSYNFLHGIDRILKILNHNIDGNWEVIVSDDSTTDEIYRYWAESRLPKNKFKYYRNNPPLGAVKNWNNLLRITNSKFCLIMHHDDFPLCEQFLKIVSDIIDSNPDVDVIVLNHIVVNKRTGIVYGSISNKIRAFLSHKCPSYVLDKNYLGSMSNLIIRKALYPMFDESLKILVDSKMYYELMKRTENWMYLDSIRMGSVIGDHYSITESLAKESETIVNAERQYLNANNINKKPLFSTKISRIFNNILWFAIGVVPKLAMALGFKMGIWPFDIESRRKIRTLLGSFSTDSKSS